MKQILTLITLLVLTGCVGTKPPVTVEVKKDPALASHYEMLAGIMFLRDQPSNAIPFLTEAIRLDTNNDDAWYYRGKAKEFMHDFHGASVDYHQAALVKKP